MEYKAKSDAAKAEADILLEEEKKSQAKKKKKSKNKVVFEVLNSLFASLTFSLIGCKNEWFSWRNRELRRACLIPLIRLMSRKYPKRHFLRVHKLFSGFL